MGFGLWTLIATLGAITLVACGSATNSIALNGTAWKLVSLNGESALPDGEVTLSFTEAEVSGNAGCNSYSGGYSLDGTALAFTPIVSTMMACEGPLMDQETAFFATLQVVQSVAIEDGQITLSAADGQTLVFQSQ